MPAAQVYTLEVSFTGKTLALEPLPCCPMRIGRDLWRLEDARARTLGAVQNLTQTQLDAEPAAAANSTGNSAGNSVGALLYHLAAIEADWLYVEVLEEAFPKELESLFPVDVRDEQGRLSPVRGVSLNTHLHRLSFVRKRLLEQLTSMTEADYGRLRRLPDYQVTPEWVVHHLAQHEALHRGQILAQLGCWLTLP